MQGAAGGPRRGGGNILHMDFDTITSAQLQAKFPRTDPELLLGNAVDKCLEGEQGEKETQRREHFCRMYQSRTLHLWLQCHEEATEDKSKF